MKEQRVWGKGGHGTAYLKKEVLYGCHICVIISILLDENLFSDSSDWGPTALSFSYDIRERSRDWKVDDQCPFASHSMTQSLSASTEFGHMILVDKKKTHIGGVFLLGYYRLCDLCESQLRGNRDSKEHKKKETERV